MDDILEAALADHSQNPAVATDWGGCAHVCYQITYLYVHAIVMLECAYRSTLRNP